MIVVLTDRQLLILEAIIRDYTEIGQPIGSKALQEQLPIHVSSATIRNEMAVLEHQGYITKEHSSSGRVPSLKGYRYYVDNIVKPAKLDKQSLKSIRNSFGNEFLKVDEIVATSAKILSDLTSYTAIMLKPDSTDLRLEGFRMVPIGHQQVMVILVASDGTVESQIFNIPPEISGDELEAVMRLINDQVVGLPLNQVITKLHATLPLLTRYLQQPAGFLDVFGNVLDKAVKEQVYVSGRMNLLNFAHDNNVEQLKSLYSLVNQVPNISDLVDNDKGISVRFGDELTNKLLLDYSLVSATYDDGHNGQGLIAILGPTNMPYAKMIGLLGAFRKELTARLIDYYQNFDNFN